MKRLKNQEAITLIALIITIIVMLILVAVTISVALNGGLFQNARDAKTKTQKETEREELMSAVFGTLDSSGNLQIATNVGDNLQSGWSAPTLTENSSYLKLTSPNGTDFYVNKTTGEIREDLPAGKTVIGTFYGIEQEDLTNSEEIAVTHMKCIQYSDGTISWDSYNFYKSDSTFVPGSHRSDSINYSTIQTAGTIEVGNSNVGYSQNYTASVGDFVLPQSVGGGLTINVGYYDAKNLLFHMIQPHENSWVTLTYAISNSDALIEGLPSN